jgi:hypothetical protein
MNNWSETPNLPGFIIVGAGKSGTSAMRHHLERHPDIYLARKEGRNPGELHFFNNEENWRKGISWYQSLFTHPDKLQGEKSPGYLHTLISHERMASVVPNAKLLVLLRNPVDRAYSHWNHFNQIIDRSYDWGWIQTDFESAISPELTANREAHRKILGNSRYIDQLSSLRRFFSAEQIHVCISERLRKDPDKEMSRIYRFLEVEQVDIEFQSRHIRKYSNPMEQGVRARLEEYFHPFNEALYEYLGERIDEWE